MEARIISSSSKLINKHISKLTIKLKSMGLSGASERFARLFIYVFLSCLTFVFIYPFLYMVITSVKTQKDLYDLSVNWIPRGIKLENFIVAAKALNYVRYLRNSLVITISATLGHVVACSFIGYGFARFKFPGQNIFFGLVILSIIVPVQTIIVPQYIVFANLGWLNSYLPLIIPTFFGFGLKGGLFTFIFRQYYQGLPAALEDAAQIDGCGFINTYFRIVLPIAKSAIIVTIVLSIVWHWNDFYEPSIYLSRPEMLPLPSNLPTLIALVNNPKLQEELFGTFDLQEMESVINEAVLMAGTFIVILPVLISYAFLQKEFVHGIERTGLVE